tara:strand:+ start:15795 stop:16868 length:1074 start_codon:yes stop_codon:yes gene_type:complete
MKKILNNMEYSEKPGMLIASPSDNPPYKYHWVRDVSIVMRVIIDQYRKQKSEKYFVKIINYINNCNDIQELNTLTGLGEPKINIDGTPYNEPWGRPQNDGPALRGLNMINLYFLLHKNYKHIAEKLIIPILQKDLNFILNNLNKPCFDLWEEIVGWHFYTRIVQLKFLKEISSNKKKLSNLLHIPDDLEKKFVFLQNNIQHHKSENCIISSFDEEGNIIRYDDASILLGFCHVDFDKSIINLFGFDRIFQTCQNLEEIFRNKYNMPTLELIGRYGGDAYYDGQTWIICSLALAQIYFHFNYLDGYEYLYFAGKQILKTIVNLNKNLDLAEQYNPLTDTFLSAEKLTWNYAELYFTIL